MGYEIYAESKRKKTKQRRLATVADISGIGRQRPGRKKGALSVNRGIRGKKEELGTKSLV